MASGLRVAREQLQIATIDRGEVLRYLGYRGQAIDVGLDRRIDDIVRRCLAMARPRMGLATYAVRSRAHDLIELEGCAFELRGRDIAEHLADASEVVLFAVTLGIEVDRELRRLSLIDPLEQVVFDSAATALAERAADVADARARAYAAAQGSYASWRFSPGYGDLPLSCQRDFLAALDAGRQLGITLTPSDLMVPTKSVTAIVGVHPTPQPGLASSCAICSLAEFCTIRATGRTCRG